MSCPTVSSPTIKLSICISTFNRASVIGETLDSMIRQVTEECEIVVSDNASTDNTESVILDYKSRCPQLRYVRHTEDLGLDRNFDRTVDMARGEYCWLMPDDDLFKPDAVKTLLRALDQPYSLVVVNAEVRNVSLTKILWPRAIDVDSDRIYGPEHLDDLFAAWKDFVTYIGCIVIRRACWLSRERKRYYGSLLMYLGVIFQDRLPGSALLISNPCVVYRYGGSSWVDKWFEVMMLNWPSLIWSMAISESIKRKVVSREPWKRFRPLLLSRAIGRYTSVEYKRYVRPRLRSFREKIVPLSVLLVPGLFANSWFLLRIRLSRSRFKELDLIVLRKSRFHYRNLLSGLYGRASLR